MNVNAAKDIGAGLISSDSDFDEAVQDAGYVDSPRKTLSPPKRKQILRNSAEDAVLRNDVSKTFKKMLTSNHKRRGEKDKDAITVTINTSQSIVEFDNNTQFEIESKF